MRSGSTSEMVSHSGAISAASPPVATTGVFVPSSSHTRRTRPSIIAASPRSSPAWTLARVFVPMTVAGGSRSTFESRAAFENSASAHVSTPGAIDSAHIRAVLGDHVDGGRGAEVDDEDRPAETLERRDAVDDAVGADLVRVVVADGHRRS